MAVLDLEAAYDRVPRDKLMDEIKKRLLPPFRKTLSALHFDAVPKNCPLFAWQYPIGSPDIVSAAFAETTIFKSQHRSLSNRAALRPEVVSFFAYFTR